MKEKKVHCRRCVSLLLIKKERILALCLGKADFTVKTVDTPLRSIKTKVLVGVPEFPEYVNLNNDCPLYRRFGSLKLLRIKRQIRRDLDARKGFIKDYSIEDEQDKVTEYYTEGQRKKAEGKKLTVVSKKASVKGKTKVETKGKTTTGTLSRVKVRSGVGLTRTSKSTKNKTTKKGNKNSGISIGDIWKRSDGRDSKNTHGR